MLSLAGGRIVFGCSRNSPNSFVTKADDELLAYLMSVKQNSCELGIFTRHFPRLLFACIHSLLGLWKATFLMWWWKGLFACFSHLTALLPSTRHWLCAGESVLWSAWHEDGLCPQEFPPFDINISERWERGGGGRERAHNRRWGVRSPWVTHTGGRGASTPPQVPRNWRGCVCHFLLPVLSGLFKTKQKSYVLVLSFFFFRKK